jgi:hypothetical protein
MSLSPTIGISKLSLESTPCTALLEQTMDLLHGDDRSRQPQDEDDDSADEDMGTTVRSPTKLTYNIERLSPDAQKSVRSLWGDPFEEPPEISLQWCERMLDGDGNDFYAFQLHEVVPRSVRIGSPKSRYAKPECQCGGVEPCKHLVWLSDYIAQQALYDHDPRTPLCMNEHGYADELGDPFQCISDIRLDVLADGLHCEVGHPLSGASAQRIADAQSIIASIADADEHVFDSYRSDLTHGPFASRPLVHHRDAEATLFSLLVASHRLSAWLRSCLRPSDPARSPFRQIESRARRIFADFDAFLASSASSSTSSSSSSSTSLSHRGRQVAEAIADREGPCDLSWAATSLTRCTRQIHTLVSRAEAPLPPAERSSAARAVVRILRGVVDRHHHGDANRESTGSSLHARLIGGGDDQGFAADSLELLVDQSQFVDELEDIMAEVGRRGAAASWVAKMEAVVARMRRNRRSRSHVRGGGGAGVEGGTRGISTAAAAGGPDTSGTRQRSRRRREESPALGPVEHGAPGSASASGVGIGGSSGPSGVAGLGIAYGVSAGSSASAGSGDAGSEFRVPEVPAAAGPSSSLSSPSSSTRARGSGRASGAATPGGAGSKRSGAGGSRSDRGSKRAR